MSQFPAEVGFGVPWVPAAERGRTRPAAGETGADLAGRMPERLSIPLQSQDDASRVRQLTDEVSSPPAHLTIVQTPDQITITDDRGRARTFHPDGRSGAVQLDGVPAGVTARWEEPAVSSWSTRWSGSGSCATATRAPWTRRSSSWTRSSWTAAARASPSGASTSPRARPRRWRRRPRRRRRPHRRRAGRPPPGQPGRAAGAPAPAEPFDQRPDAELRDHVASVSSSRG